MARALIVLRDAADKAKAVNWISKAPPGTRVEFKASQRTLDQNSRMWAMLTDIATQKKHAGRSYTPNDWKIIFLHALGRETRFVPNLDGDGFIPIGQSSSDLSKAEMSEMIELIAAWGSQNGVVFNDSKEIAA